MANTDKIGSFSQLEQYILRSGDDELIETWHIITARLLFPPTQLGAVASECATLTELCTKTGVMYGWATPPQHSEAMERLIHRLTCLQEAMVKMLEQSHEH